MGYKLRGKTIDDFLIGENIFTASRTVTEADVVNFARLSGDFNPLHTDEVFMKNSDFGGRIVYGALVSAIASGQITQLGIFEGTMIAGLQAKTSYTGVVRPGEWLLFRLRC